MSAGTRIEWAIALQELCKMANVAFFFKKPYTFIEYFVADKNFNGHLQSPNLVD